MYCLAFITNEEKAKFLYKILISNAGFNKRKESLSFFSTRFGVENMANQTGCRIAISNRL